MRGDRERPRPEVRILLVPFLAISETCKDGVTRGNVADLAVGIIIGAAFGKIVTSLVNDILIPSLGLILGKMDFSGLFMRIFAQYDSNCSEVRRSGFHPPSIGSALILF